ARRRRGGRDRRRRRAGPRVRPGRVAGVPGGRRPRAAGVERLLPGVPGGLLSHVEVYGIRHHGPGSARALRGALEEFKPDAVLIEGPPEADPIVELAGEPGMAPPVALLAYSPAPASASGAAGGERGDRRAAFWPSAEFSPEWQAIRYALGAGVPVRFCDLPAAHQLAPPAGTEAENSEGENSEGGGSEEGGSEGEGPGEDGSAPDPAEGIRLDPLGWLANAAGYDDAERWW